jgi:Uma2 family endonuclease
MREKLSLYEWAGVREYWVVHPVEQTIMIFTLSEGRYSRPDVYGKGDELKAALLDNLVIDLNRVFR